MLESGTNSRLEVGEEPILEVERQGRVVGQFSHVSAAHGQEMAIESDRLGQSGFCPFVEGAPVAGWEACKIVRLPIKAETPSGRKRTPVPLNPSVGVGPGRGGIVSWRYCSAGPG